MRSLYFLLLLVFVAGCSQLDPVSPENPLNQFTVSGSVFKDGVPASGVGVFVIFSDGQELTSTTSPAGEFMLNANAEPVLVVCAEQGYSGLANGPFVADEDIVVTLEPLTEEQFAVGPTRSSVLSEYWWGVYDTDSHGDVRFRYQYSFRRFGCSSWLPWLGISTNPNNWTSWDLTDFRPWNGKKLLVPGRYQWWHRQVYGFSISQALYLVSVR